LHCNFDGSSSSDPDGTVSGYAWSFGQGQGNGSGVKPGHDFTAAGTYTVTLVVQDDDGAFNSTSKQVTVSAG
jgi:PKD repeat protein